MVDEHSPSKLWSICVEHKNVSMVELMAEISKMYKDLETMRELKGAMADAKFTPGRNTISVMAKDSESALTVARILEIIKNG